MGGWMKTEEMARKKKRGRKRRKFLQARVKAKIVKMKEGAEKRRKRIRKDLGPGLWKDEEEVEVKRQEEKRIKIEVKSERKGEKEVIVEISRERRGLLAKTERGRKAGGGVVKRETEEVGGKRGK